MDIDLQKKLTSLDNGQIEIIRRLDDVAKDLKNTMVEIGGVPDEIGRDPDRRSLRARLHVLENDQAAVRLATDAVNAARTMRDASAEKQFTRREKLAGLLIAVVVAAGPYIAPFFHH